MLKNIRELFTREERARKQILSPVLSSYGLTPGQGQARILHYLRKEDGITQKELAFRCHMDTTTMSRNIDKLENLGLLKRENDPNSRRSVQIFLTDRGSEMAINIGAMFTTFENVLVEDVSEKDLETFYNVLIKMCENLERYIEKNQQ